MARRLWYLVSDCPHSLLTIAVLLWAPKGLWGSLVACYDLRLFPVQRRLRFDAEEDATPAAAPAAVPRVRSAAGAASAAATKSPFTRNAAPRPD